ncbi:MAG: ATP-binding cassette domain-containing protein [Candidatus Latescibacterota bacterium]|nr:MAG: ATP-binding cassette domain-containing protein [Candidatus Latescibacterota bacterium]
MTGSGADAIISVDGVSKQFATVCAVDDLSFRIKRGKIFALLGPNGAGKTTLVRMLVGVNKPDSGVISFYDDNGVSFGLENRARSGLTFGYLPEERGLYSDQPVLRTLVYFGVLYGMSRPKASEAAAGWLKRFDLAERAGEKLEALSKGNQQKIQFVSAVLHRPRLVILDEPFSGLDPLNQELFLDIIGELRSEGTTVLLSAHQMNLVEQIADHILVIDQGREILSGTMADIRAQAASRDKIIFSMEDNRNATALEAHPTIRKVEKMPGGEVIAWLEPDAKLADVIEVIAADFHVTSINSARVSLHEIFVDTVGRKNGGTR